MNSPEEIKLRKYKNTLSITGMGVIIFGMWNFIKLLLYCFFKFDYIEEILEMKLEGGAKVVFIVFLTIFFILDIIFRTYIGKNAIKESRGIKKGYLYIVFTILIIAVS